MFPCRPNVLFVLADDLGQGDVSCFNDRAGWVTPAMDRLAAEGMRFTDSHATSSLCTPSRYGALTGRYNWRSRLRRSVLPGDSTALIEKDRTTLPLFLQSEGYRTAVVGKWHLGLDWQMRAGGADVGAFGLDPQQHHLSGPRMGRNGNFDPDLYPSVEGTDIDYTRPIAFGPNQLGFDYSFITAASLDQPPYVYIENGTPLGEPTAFGGDQTRLDRRTTAHQQQIQAGPMVPGYDITKVAPDFQDRALAVLDSYLEQDQPWFLYVPSHLVHGPIIPNEPWSGSSGKGAYADFVLQFDAYVGQLVDRIDAAGARENTIVVVTSDNGASGVAGLAELHEHGHDPSNGWRGWKSDIWEGGHREPFIVRWPARIEAGSVSSHLVSHTDLFATLAEVLGAELPETAAEDSVSSLPLWLGRDAPTRTDLVSHSGGGGFAIRRGDWKLEFTTTGDGMEARYEQAQRGPATEYRPAQLYNLSEDPAEQNNLIDRYPQLVIQLSQLLATQVTRGRSTPGPASANERVDDSAPWYQLEWMQGLGPVDSVVGITR